MFSKGKLKYIFKIFIVFLYLFFSFQSKLIAQNSSAFNNVRNTTGNNCTDLDLYKGKKAVKPCYTSQYSHDNEECVRPEFKFNP
jgi:hypothetical protein